MLILVTIIANWQSKCKSANTEVERTFLKDYDFLKCLVKKVFSSARYWKATKPKPAKTMAIIAPMAMNEVPEPPVSGTSMS